MLAKRRLEGGAELARGKRGRATPSRYFALSAGDPGADHHPGEGKAQEEGQKEGGSQKMSRTWALDPAFLPGIALIEDGLEGLASGVKGKAPSTSRCGETTHITGNSGTNVAGMPRTLRMPGLSSPPQDLPSLRADRSGGQGYTPLEKQVAELKKQHPDTILFVQVGYKYVLFGDDARVASEVLHIKAYEGKNMLNAFIPDVRLSVHLRRMLEAGHKVGIVTQAETAALKKISGHKSGPFTRFVSAVYTRATMIDDVVSLDGADLSDSRANAPVAPALVALHEHGRGRDRAATLIRLTPSTGDLVFEKARVSPLGTELETLLFNLQPLEILVCAGALSADAAEAVKRYCAGRRDVCSVSYSERRGRRGWAVRSEGMAGDRASDLAKDMSDDMENDTAKGMGNHIPSHTAMVSASAENTANDMADDTAHSTRTVATAKEEQHAPLQERKRERKPNTSSFAYQSGLEQDSTHGISPPSPPALTAPPALSFSDPFDSFGPSSISVASLLSLSEGGGSGEESRDALAREDVSVDASGLAETSPRSPGLAKNSPRSPFSDDRKYRPSSLDERKYRPSSSDERNIASVRTALIRLIDYLTPLNMASLILAPGRKLTRFSTRRHMLLSARTLVNLGVVATDANPTGSLFSIINRCRTPFGRRRMYEWVTRPLRDRAEIETRLDAVEEALASTNPMLTRLSAVLRGLPDLERGLMRIHLGRISPAELVRVLTAFQTVAAAFDAGQSRFVRSPFFKRVIDALPAARGPTAEFLSLLDPAAISGASVFRDMWGLSAPPTSKTHSYPPVTSPPRIFCEDAASELFEPLRDIRACEDLVAFEMDEELVRCRSVLGKPGLNFSTVGSEPYLLEVWTDEYRKRVPTEWVRISSTRSTVRVRSPVLQQKLQELHQWRERHTEASRAIFQMLLARIDGVYSVLRDIVAQLATADCLFSLARSAVTLHYTRPVFSDAVAALDIRGGRNPVIEGAAERPCVANDVRFDAEGMRQMVLTGINMGGKSSTSRMIALVVLLAHVGSFVPAKSCKLGLFDGIFTRMGAGDDLFRGRSTFMQELGETSGILRASTARSLVILDELGRGTSSVDGLAIASAVLEYLARRTRCLCVFVTHYPDISIELDAKYESVKTYHMACIEHRAVGGKAAAGKGEGEGSVAGSSQGMGPPIPDLTFLYRLVPGLSRKSHGVYVAKLAKLRGPLLLRALAKARALQMEMTRRRSKKISTRFAALLCRLGPSEPGRSGEYGVADSPRTQRRERDKGGERDGEKILALIEAFSLEMRLQ